jgi:hypothetical protein
VLHDECCTLRKTSAVRTAVLAPVVKPGLLVQQMSYDSSSQPTVSNYNITYMPNQVLHTELHTDV